MAHLVNPLLLDGFLDDEPSKSAQGCFTGSDYWKAELMTDIALYEERAIRSEIMWRRRTINRLKEELATAKEKGYVRKVEWIEQRIETQENALSQLPPLI